MRLRSRRSGEDVDEVDGGAERAAGRNTARIRCVAGDWKGRGRLGTALALSRADLPEEAGDTTMTRTSRVHDPITLAAAGLAAVLVLCAPAGARAQEIDPPSFSGATMLAAGTQRWF